MEINQSSSGMMNGIPPVPKEEKKIGPILGVLVIVLAIIVAVLYFFTGKINNVTPAQDTTTTSSEQISTTTKTDEDVSDEKTIEADLDSQLKDIDYSF